MGFPSVRAGNIVAIVSGSHAAVQIIADDSGVQVTVFRMTLEPGRRV
jgi:hypothetical protein